jgi:hypothetical protein
LADAIFAVVFAGLANICWLGVIGPLYTSGLTVLMG